MADKDKRTIFQRMVGVMRDIEPIAKGRKNVSQNFMFRGIDDVYNALQGILAKHGVLALPYVVAERTEERRTMKGGTLIYRVLTIDYHFYGEDGDTLPLPVRVIGEGMDSGDKASNKAMAVADKYTLLQAFKIPTEEQKDPDAESPEVAPKDEPKPEQPPRSKEQPRRDPPREQPQGNFQWRTVDVVRFGDNKKKRIADLDDVDLHEYATAVGVGLERGKGYATQDHLDAIYEEIAKRESGTENAPRGDEPPPHGDDEYPF